MFREREVTIGKVLNGLFIFLALLGLFYVIGLLFSENAEHHKTAEVLIEDFSSKFEKETAATAQLLKTLFQEFESNSQKTSQSQEQLLLLSGLKKENEGITRLMSLQQKQSESLSSDLHVLHELLLKISSSSSSLSSPSSPTSPSSTQQQQQQQPPLDSHFSHPSLPTDRLIKPFSNRPVTVTPGSLFKQQLVEETLPDEVISAKRVQEEDKSFFAFFGQRHLGQDPILEYLFEPNSDEERIRGVFKSIFRETQQNPAIMMTGPVFLDIGANMGYYSLLTAAFGFPVISFEPQPHCHLFLKTASVLNGFEDKVTLVSGLVGSDPSATMEAEHRTGCWGTWPQDNKASKVAEKYRRPPVHVGEIGVDELLEELYIKQGREIPIIPLMKIDTEGFEFQVLHSARKLLASKKVKNILVEFNTRAYDRSKTTAPIAKEMLLWLTDKGYGFQCMGDNGNDYFTQKRPNSMETLLQRASTLKIEDPYSTDCWLYLQE